MGLVQTSKLPLFDGTLSSRNALDKCLRMRMCILEGEATASRDSLPYSVSSTDGEVRRSARLSHHLALAVQPDTTSRGRPMVRED